MVSDVYQPILSVAKLQGLKIQTLFQEKSAHLLFPNGKTAKLQQGKDYLVYIHPSRVSPADSTATSPINVLTFTEHTEPSENLDDVAKEIPNFTMFNPVNTSSTSTASMKQTSSSFFDAMAGMLQELPERVEEEAPIPIDPVYSTFKP